MRPRAPEQERYDPQEDENNGAILRMKNGEVDIRTVQGALPDEMQAAADELQQDDNVDLEVVEALDAARERIAEASEVPAISGRS